MDREPNCDNARCIDFIHFIPFGLFLCVFVQFYHAFLYKFVVRFYSARNARIASAVLAVCLSVCHTPVLCQNGGT